MYPYLPSMIWKMTLQLNILATSIYNKHTFLLLLNVTRVNIIFFWDVEDCFETNELKKKKKGLSNVTPTAWQESNCLMIFENQVV